MLQKYHLYNTRLDFDNLVLDSPAADGAVAAIDRLVIGGAQTTALTTFGGINTGQHGKFPNFLYAFKTLQICLSFVREYSLFVNKINCSLFVNKKVTNNCS